MRWLVWIIVVIVWTTALEMPVSEPDGPAGEFIWTNKYLFTKTVHVVSYGVLTVLSAWVPMNARYRWLMMFFVMGHAWGTEMLQKVLHDWCHRGGSLEDVGYDILGIIVGVAASWKVWARG